MSTREDAPPPTRQTAGWVLLVWIAIALVVLCVVLTVLQTTNLWLLPAMVLTVLTACLAITRRRT